MPDVKIKPVAQCSKVTIQTENTLRQCWVDQMHMFEKDQAMQK